MVKGPHETDQDNHPLRPYESSSGLLLHGELRSS